MTFVIKAEIQDPGLTSFVFEAQKTMYGGKQIAESDTIYIFGSENQGGRGLVGRGRVTSAQAIPKSLDVKRQPPRVSIVVCVTARAKLALGRSELKHHKNWGGGCPEAELNFKLYRQATNKIVGISATATSFLESYF